jgi:hypothetical protein
VKNKPIRTMDTSTQASDPGGVEVSDERLRRFCLELYGWSGRSKEQKERRRYLTEHMLYGDSRAAVVVSQSPFLVAAYSDELDCVVLLRFPAELGRDRPIGARLLTVNTYRRGRTYASDVVPGPQREERYVNFHPIIADFICADIGQVDRRKGEISEEEWARTFAQGNEYVAARPGLSRDGSPCRSDEHGPAGT